MVVRKLPTCAELPYWEVKVSNQDPTTILLASAHSPKAATMGAVTRATSSEAMPIAPSRPRDLHHEAPATSTAIAAPAASAS